MANDFHTSLWPVNTTHKIQNNGIYLIKGGEQEDAFNLLLKFRFFNYKMRENVRRLPLCL